MNSSVKQVTSPFGILLTYNITIGERVIKQNQYITEFYVYVETADKKIAFLR